MILKGVYEAAMVVSKFHEQVLENKISVDNSRFIPHLSTSLFIDKALKLSF